MASPAAAATAVPAASSTAAAPAAAPAATGSLGSHAVVPMPPSAAGAAPEPDCYRNACRRGTQWVYTAILIAAVIGVVLLLKFGADNGITASVAGVASISGAAHLDVWHLAKQNAGECPSPPTPKPREDSVGTELARQLDGRAKEVDTLQGQMAALTARLQSIASALAIAGKPSLSAAELQALHKTLEGSLQAQSDGKAQAADVHPKTDIAATKALKAFAVVLAAAIAQMQKAEGDNKDLDGKLQSQAAAHQTASAASASQIADLEKALSEALAKFEADGKDDAADEHSDSHAKLETSLKRKPPAAGTATAAAADPADGDSGEDAD